MVQIQYQALTAPIGTSLAETVMESKWHLPWSEPSAFLAKINPQRAIALIASGFVISPAALALVNPTPVQAAGWDGPAFATTVIYEDYQGPVLANGQSNETVQEAKWHQPYSEPVRVPRRLFAGAQPNYVAPPNVTPPVIGAIAWFAPLQDPVRVPRRLAPALNQFEPDNPFGMSRPETVTFDRWNYPWSEPKRFKAGLATPEQASEFRAIPPMAETVTFDRWNYPWSEPVRHKPRLSTGLQRDYFATGKIAPPYEEIVTESRWHFPYSEPVRSKPRLLTALQSSYVGPVDVDVPVAEPEAWWAMFSEPVRVPARLMPAAQPFMTVQVIVPLKQDPKLVMKNSIRRLRTMTS